MWVVTTDNKTVSIEGARRLEVNIHRNREGDDEAPLRDVTLSAVWPDGARETLAVIPASASDTPESLARRASAAVEAVRHALHKAGRLSDLTGMDASHETDEAPPRW